MVGPRENISELRLLERCKMLALVYADILFHPTIEDCRKCAGHSFVCTIGPTMVGPGEKFSKLKFSADWKVLV